MGLLPRCPRAYSSAKPLFEREALPARILIGPAAGSKPGARRKEAIRFDTPRAPDRFQRLFRSQRPHLHLQFERATETAEGMGATRATAPVCPDRSRPSAAKYRWSLRP